jgi:ParB/RepB/Spo0J family partition protein
MKTARVPLGRIVRDPEQPRKRFDDTEISALGANMKSVGQQVPVILFPADDRNWMLGDGERRHRAAELFGITDLIAVLLSERPSKAQLRIIQASIDTHRASLNPMERSNNLAEIQKETGWTVGELSRQLSVQQSQVTLSLSLQRLAPEVQTLVANRSLVDMQKVYQISKLEDHAAQIELAKEATCLSREAVLARVKGNGKPQAKSKRAEFLLAGGASITFKGNEFTLEELVAQMNEMVKRLRKGLAEGLDVVTIQRVFKDKAR